MYEDVETGLINQLMMSYELAVMWRHPVVSSALDSYAKRVIRAYYVYESTHILTYHAACSTLRKIELDISRFLRSALLQWLLLWTYEWNIDTYDN